MFGSFKTDESNPGTIGAFIVADRSLLGTSYSFGETDNSENDVFLSIFYILIVRIYKFPYIYYLWVFRSEAKESFDIRLSAYSIRSVSSFT